jgi:hypothetical protein
MFLSKFSNEEGNKELLGENFNISKHPSGVRRERSHDLIESKL